MFILSLATADLIVGCFVMPIAGIYAIMEKWNMGMLFIFFYYIRMEGLLYFASSFSD